MSERTEAEVIKDAYLPEHMLLRAPVQGYQGGIPWPIHLEAYDAYCKRYGRQTALIDLKGRGCRGGFGTEEMDEFVPGWRERVSPIAELQQRLVAAERELGELRASAATVQSESEDAVQDADGLAEWLVDTGCVSRSVSATLAEELLKANFVRIVPNSQVVTLEHIRNVVSMRLMPGLDEGWADAAIKTLDEAIAREQAKADDATAGQPRGPLTSETAGFA